jgi:hypothetical protein
MMMPSIVEQTLLNPETATAEELIDTLAHLAMRETETMTTLTQITAEMRAHGPSPELNEKDQITRAFLGQLTLIHREISGVLYKGTYKAIR